MSLAAKIALCVALLIAGFMGGVKYHAGVIAQRDLTAAELQKSDGIQQRRFNDAAASRHAAVTSTLSTQLGDARARIAKLSDRECFSAATAGMLNAVGVVDGGAAAGEPSRATESTAPVADVRYSTEQDVAVAIATCRAWYGTVSDQVNRILDIEDTRHPQASQ